MRRINSNRKMHIVLIGASIGKAWNIERLPDRVDDHRYSFEYVGNYSPDKTVLLTELLRRQNNKPDVVIIKECAAFFPHNAERIRKFIPQWVDSCRDSNIVPVLATVVPVVKSYPFRIFLYNLLHARIGVPWGTFNSIIAFNEWIREYARREGLEVLDLESALRSGPSNKYLNSEYALSDGLHINEKAYRMLDDLAISVVDKLQ